MSRTYQDLFQAHAEFYRERYVPFLIDEGFIDSVEDSEFGEGVDGFKPLPTADLESLPRSYRELLSSVGHGDIHFPTEEGPARFSVLAPADLPQWKEMLPRFLDASADSPPSPTEAVPFLVDDGGGLIAFLASKNDERVFLASHEGMVRGPVASLPDFFSTMFQNGRERRMPFDGM